jgi:hypothetical protein
MNDYVKYCINIHPNPELANSCEQCGQDISAVSPEPRRPVIEVQTLHLTEHAQVTCDEKPEDDQTTPTLTLISSKGIEYTVLSGDIVGKNREGCTAQVRLGDESGDSVHRRHCQFLFEHNGWVVVSLEQPQGWHTNSTFVNDHKIDPATPGTVEDGDVIRLEETEYRIRLLNG